MTALLKADLRVTEGRRCLGHCLLTEAHNVGRWTSQMFTVNREEMYFRTVSRSDTLLMVKALFQTTLAGTQHNLQLNSSDTEGQGWEEENRVSKRLCFCASRNCAQRREHCDSQQCRPWAEGLQAARGHGVWWQWGARARAVSRGLGKSCQKPLRLISCWILRFWPLGM